MTKAPKRVSDRLIKSVSNFQKVLENARARDVNESDTVTIITDMLSEVFGFDKYAEVTSEQAIRGTFCDLAVRLDGEIRYLIEVKAIGISPKEAHIRQAVGYGASEGIPWVVLTNGIDWQIYKIRFEQPVTNELVCAFDMLSINPRAEEDLDKIFLLCKEGLLRTKSAIEEFHAISKLINKFTIAAIIRGDSVISVIRRELKRLSPEAKITVPEVESLLADILKREVLDGEEAQGALKLVNKAQKKALRRGKTKGNMALTEPVITEPEIQGSALVTPPQEVQGSPLNASE